MQIKAFKRTTAPQEIIIDNALKGGVSKANSLANKAKNVTAKGAFGVTWDGHQLNCTHAAIPANGSLAIFIMNGKNIVGLYEIEEGHGEGRHHHHAGQAITIIGAGTEESVHQEEHRVRQ